MMMYLMCSGGGLRVEQHGRPTLTPLWLPHFHSLDTKAPRGEYVGLLGCFVSCLVGPVDDIFLLLHLKL